MKILAQVCIFMLFSFTSMAQDYSVVDLLNEQYKLNSGGRAAFGGVSRVAIPIKVPAYTKYLYLTISTSETNQLQAIVNGVSAATQLTMALQGAGARTINQLGSQIQGTVGNGNVCIYILPNEQNARIFLNKQDGYWQLYNGNYRENLSGGTFGVELPELPGSVLLYVGFKNPSGYKAEYVHVEASAMVRSN